MTLTYRKQSQSGPNLQHTGRCEKWMIDMIRNISGESPIVRAIFEEITQGHSGVRESMNKNGFQ